MKRIKQFFAILMMAMAVWLLGRILSPFWINWLWAAFLLATAFILNHGRHESRGFSRLLQIVAAVSLVSAGAFAYKAIQFNAKATAATASAPFEMVHSLAEVKERLAKAKESHQPVFIEFFANWCSDCQAMDKKVFNQPDVIAAMKGGINLRVDISEKNEAVAAIRKEFVVLGIPTMAFYNAEGQRLDALSAAGQLSKEQMLDLLRQFNETKSS